MSSQEQVHQEFVSNSDSSIRLTFKDDSEIDEEPSQESALEAETSFDSDFHGFQSETTEAETSIGTDFHGFTSETTKELFPKFEIKCEICNKVFKKKESLNRHKRAHKNKNPFKCKYCPEKFKFMKLVYLHMDKVHIKICKGCGIKYGRQRSLDLHCCNLL